MVSIIAPTTTTTTLAPPPPHIPGDHLFPDKDPWKGFVFVDPANVTEDIFFDPEFDDQEQRERFL